ncbi:baeRF12 domain-containing protein [Rhizobium sp. RAF56]|uniref:baeRF12 domain-containing protein n=1 Tax=Rhizobium sp. RAF56 TaxID=3233062 RepID=UPI003F9879CE
MRIRSNDWILVCDGSKALYLRNEGNTQNLNLVQVRTSVNVSPPTRLLGNDRPGRVHASIGEAGSAVETPDLHERLEQAFLAREAAAIEEDIEKGSLSRLLLIAPPRALGFLRRRLGAAARTAVFAEIAKDFTKMPVHEIGARLQKETEA